jgi:hypothetical protein
MLKNMTKLTFKHLLEQIHVSQTHVSVDNLYKQKYVSKINVTFDYVQMLKDYVKLKKLYVK